MKKVQNLLNLKGYAVKKFLDSFDTVVTDCDGVLWLGYTPIEKSFETLNKLKQLGKKIIFVSNNSTITAGEYCEKFQRFGCSVDADHIAIPSRVICWYLKKLKFDGKVFLLSTNTFRNVLQADGINIAEPCPSNLEGNIPLVLKALHSQPDVKAVIVDLDVNINWLKISKSIEYLKNKDVLYLAGVLDRRVPVGKNVTVLGNRAFVDIISKGANREPVRCSKPSETMKNYITEKFQLDKNPSRCLFIGDSFEMDMKFADLCGFGKLWVASGVDTLESLTNISNNEDHSLIPDYYLPSLGHLLNIIDS